MADIAGDASLASWVQAGGVIAFAGAVLMQLREIKPFLGELTKTLGEVRTTMASLLERERTRAERLAAQDAARQAMQFKTGGAVPENWDGHPTGTIEIPHEHSTPTPKKRMQTNPGVGDSTGYRGPQRGGSDRP